MVPPLFPLGHCRERDHARSLQAGGERCYRAISAVVRKSTRKYGENVAGRERRIGVRTRRLRLSISPDETPPGLAYPLIRQGRGQLTGQLGHVLAPLSLRNPMLIGRSVGRSRCR